METKESVTISQSLIKGVFNGEEAKDIILSMIDYKIQFHHKKLLNHFDKTGEALFASDQRISELKKIRKDLSQFLNSHENKSVQIKSDIDISIH